MSNTIQKIQLLMACSIVLFVCACGQKGDLYIDKSASQKSKAAVDVSKPSNKVDQSEQTVLDGQEEGS